MKSILILLLASCCVLASSGDAPLGQKQKDVLLLLSHINEYIPYKEWIGIVDSYNVSEHISEFTKPEVVHDFELYYPYDILPKNEIFSVMYDYQLKEAIMLFKLFYYASTYQTFFNTAVWARYHFNQGLFLYAYSVAVVHRSDMQGVVLPPIYEIYPYYFYDASVIQQAYYYKQVHSTQHPNSAYNQQYGYTVVANYSGYYLNLHPEQKTLSYYLEDVGINAYYYYYQLYYPFWMSGTEFGFANVNRGMQYFFLYQQLLAKFYMERLSNYLGEIPYFNWDVPIETPYYPSLEYPNGIDFPYRPAYVDLHEYFYNYGQQWTWKGVYGYSHLFVKDYEQRLNEVIDHGYVYYEGQKISLYTPEGLNTLGNIVQANPDSPDSKYYGLIWLFGSHLLGYSYQPLNQHQIIPSVLEHFETSMRDPMFYQLYKKIWLKFYRYLYSFPPYTTHDLVYPGVKVTSVVIDKLVTYYDYFYSDLSNAVFYSPEELLSDSFHIRVAQERLNHKPFTYKISVDSELETKAVVKIFLTPIYDVYGEKINITENQVNVVLLDYFVYSLKKGGNVITRGSHETYLYGQDLLSYKELYQKYANVQQGKGEVPTFSYPNYYGFPDRYMLPLGSTSGTPYAFYVYIYPYVSSKVQPSTVYDSYFYPYEGDVQFYDNYSLLFPFDKPIVHEHIWYNIPNSYLYETKIYHVEDVNVVH